MKFKSAAGWLFGSPGTSRRPLISTRVRFGPRPRRSTVAVPVAPLDKPAALVGEDRRQLVEQVFDAGRTRQLESCVVDDRDRRAEVRFGCGMRVPVMMMSLAVWTGAPRALRVGVGFASTGPVG